MVLHIMFIRSFLYIINAPILPIDEHDGRAVGHIFNPHLLGQVVADMVFTAPIAAQERTKHQDLEMVQ